MAALYLRGLSRPVQPSTQRWPVVEGLLRRECPSGRSITSVLSKAGLWAESAAFEAAIEEAESVFYEGRVLTSLCSTYPRRWLRVLGPASPPALWLAGDASLLVNETISVVGSRHLSPWHAELARAASAAVAPASLVSGGAPGADSLASRAARGPVIEILPAGFAAWPASKTRQPLVRLSLWPPNATFTTGGAMERNTLLYAFSEITVLAHARFKEGGSWHGAVNALRRRLTHLLVPNDGQLAHRALIALGAHPIPAAESIGASLESIKQMSGLNAPEGLLGPNVPAKPSPPFQSALQ